MKKKWLLGAVCAVLILAISILKTVLPSASGCKKAGMEDKKKGG